MLNGQLLSALREDSKRARESAKLTCVGESTNG
jgi:hypothetical protein